MRLIIFIILLSSAAITGRGSDYNGTAPVVIQQQDDDSLLWQLARQFTALFNEGSTSAMANLLPDNFMIQWMHQNSFGKKGLLNMMADSAVHSGFRYHLHHNAQSYINYSDDRKSASIDASAEFIDKDLLKSINKEYGYGLCIMYFEKKKSGWVLRTIHIDVHCSLCNL